MERKKLIDIEEKEILRKEKELIATVKRPAEATAYKLETLAEGQRSVEIIVNCIRPKQKLHVYIIPVIWFCKIREVGKKKCYSLK